MQFGITLTCSFAGIDIPFFEWFLLYLLYKAQEIPVIRFLHHLADT